MTCQHCKAQCTWGTYASRVQKQSRSCPDCWHKPFPITSVCRADLQEMLTGAEIAKVDDGDMDWLSGKLADAYTESAFWIDLKIMARQLIENKHGRA